jgi:hypothetical protein
MISAEMICDSVSPQGHRLTTLRLRYPKWIHSEFMTHRVFSRNASSSRAIPTAEYLEEARSDALRAAPVWWGKASRRWCLMWCSGRGSVGDDQRT